MSTASLTPYEAKVERMVLFVKDFIEVVLESHPVDRGVEVLHYCMSAAGIPSAVHPSADQLALCFAATVMTLFNYYFLFGNRHHRRRRMLLDDLKSAAERLHELEDKLIIATAEDNEAKSQGREVR
jgi:ethanolamine-phosphate cytidylyltransferase